MTSMLAIECPLLGGRAVIKFDLEGHPVLTSLFIQLAACGMITPQLCTHWPGQLVGLGSGDCPPEYDFPLIDPTSGQLSGELRSCTSDGGYPDDAKRPSRKADAWSVIALFGPCGKRLAVSTAQLFVMLSDSVDIDGMISNGNAACVGQVIAGREVFLAASVTPRSDVSEILSSVTPPNPKVRFTFALSSATRTVDMEVFLAEMPLTASNFLDLVKSGFYDGLHVHRLVAGFVLQVGCPLSKDPNARQQGSGGPQPDSKFPNLSLAPVFGSTLFEAKESSFARDKQGKIIDELTCQISNDSLTLSMANKGSPNTGGSQFFINFSCNSKLDWFNTATASKHPVFARVLLNDEIVIRELEKLPINKKTEAPLHPLKIVSAVVL